MLDHPVRGAILGALAGAEGLSVGALARALGEPQPAVTKAIARLRAAGLVTTRRDGQRVFVRRVPLPPDRLAWAANQARLLSARGFGAEHIASALRQAKALAVVAVDVHRWRA